MIVLYSLIDIHGDWDIIVMIKYIIVNKWI